MSQDYVFELNEFSETNPTTYQQVLNECQNDIIDAFGGLDAMIQLCLTNPEFSTDTYKSQFDAFKNLMESKNIDIENEIKCNVTNKHNDVKIATIGKIDNKHKQVILHNLEEFYRYSFGMMVYYSDSIYFIFLAPATAKYIFDHVLHTRMYPICCIIIFAILAIASQLYWYLFALEYDAIYYALIKGPYCVGIVFPLSYIFSANISMVTFIVQTFDFWYKMYNLMDYIIIFCYCRIFQ